MPAAVVSITTGDAAPTVAPHKISAQATKDKATVVFESDRTVSAFRLREGGSDQSTGTLIHRRGRLQCGAFKIGAGKKVSAVTYASGADQTQVIDDSDLSAGADGSRTINIWQHVPNGAWD